MSYKIIGKYIKKLDFKIPNSKTFSMLSKEISNYKINIDIQSNQIRDKIIEVDTTLKLIPLNESNENITTKIIYSTIVELKESVTDKTIIEKIILINVPTEIYPELRKIFINIFETSGFKDIKINDKVDFHKLYNLKQTQ